MATLHDCAVPTQCSPDSLAHSKLGSQNSSRSLTPAPTELSLAKKEIHIFPQFARGVQAKQDVNQEELSANNKTASKDIIASLLQDDISLTDGELLHARIVHTGLDRDIFLANLLISAYGRFGLVEEAGWVFDTIPCRSIVSWSAIISVYVEHGHDRKAITLFQEMSQAGLRANSITVVRILTACANQRMVEDGRYTHAVLIGYGINIDNVTGTALLTMYGKCAELDSAKQVFNIMQEHDTISWNAMMAALKQNDDNLGAGVVFELMQEREIYSNTSTFLTALAACASIGLIEKGRLIHQYILKDGLDSEAEVANALIYMYGVCGDLEEADCLFRHMQHRDVVSWNSMISAYAQRGYFREAYDLFQQMQAHVRPTRATFLNMLSGCASPQALSIGEDIHTHISQARLDSDLLVATALIDMYGECGAIASARRVFDNTEEPDIICWNAMISCYSQHSQDRQAMKLFKTLFQIGWNPDKITLSSILGACSDVEYIPIGKLIHAYIVENSFDLDTVILHALIHMYGNNGNLEESRALFDKLDSKELTAWNAMIGAYSQQGHAMQAIELYEEMLRTNIGPDGVTFVSLLSACSHAGLVDRGYGYFVSIREVHGLTPSIEHYNCLIDLFVRAGWLDVAKDLVQLMPFNDTSLVWSTMLSGHGLHQEHVTEKCSISSQ